MDTNPVLSSLIEKYSILQTSALHTYFSQKNLSTTDVPLGVILEVVIHFCMSEGHFDPRNPSVILCQRSQLLENIFGMKALHVSQVRAALAKSLLPLKPLAITVVPRPVIKTSTKYRLSRPLGQLFVSAGLIPSSEKTFTFTTAGHLLAEYVLSKRASLLDARNVSVALLAGDPLAQVFQVTAFHRSQLPTLLKTQLFEVEEVSLRRKLLIRL